MHTKSFKAESTALTRLANATHSSPNVVQLLAKPLDRKGERVFLLPLAQSNLESLLLGDGDTSGFVASACRQFHSLGQALSAIHKETIVHGDSKPENILMFQSGDAQDSVLRKVPER